MLGFRMEIENSPGVHCLLILHSREFNPCDSVLSFMCLTTHTRAVFQCGLLAALGPSLHFLPSWYSLWMGRSNSGADRECGRWKVSQWMEAGGSRESGNGLVAATAWWPKPADALLDFEVYTRVLMNILISKSYYTSCRTLGNHLMRDRI